MRWSGNGRAIVANVVGHLADVRYEASGIAVDFADPADCDVEGIYWVAATNMANWIAQQGSSS